MMISLIYLEWERKHLFRIREFNDKIITIGDFITALETQQTLLHNQLIYHCGKSP